MLTFAKVTTAREDEEDSSSRGKVGSSRCATSAHQVAHMQEMFGTQKLNCVLDGVSRILDQLKYYPTMNP